MNIKGLQKLTLLDFPGAVACTVFLGGCNFRCPFCHNASLVLSSESIEGIPEADFFSFLESRRRVLDGVAVTGGEPLLSPDLGPFLTRIRGMGFRVKLDTNGSFPEKLRALVKGGCVDYVAMDIKASQAGYAAACGTEHFLSGVRESVSFLLSGAVDYEFRTTVTQELHDGAEMKRIGEWIRGAEHYFLQQYKDNGETVGASMTAYDEAGMKALLSEVLPYVPTAALRGL